MHEQILPIFGHHKDNPLWDNYILLYILFQSVPSRPHPPTYISYEPGRDLAFVYRIFMKYEDELKKKSSDAFLKVTS